MGLSGSRWNRYGYTSRYMCTETSHAEEHDYLAGKLSHHWLNTCLQCEWNDTIITYDFSMAFHITGHEVEFLIWVSCQGDSRLMSINSFGADLHIFIILLGISNNNGARSTFRKLDQWKLIFGPTSDDNTGGGLKFVAEDNSTFYKKSLRFFFIRVACKLQVAWGENWRTQLKGIVLSRSTLKNSLDSKSIFLTLAGFSIFYKMQISYCFGLSKAFLSQLDTFFSASLLWESTSCFI